MAKMNTHTCNALTSWVMNTKCMRNAHTIINGERFCYDHAKKIRSAK